MPEPGWKSVQKIPPPSLVDYKLDWAAEARRFEPGIPDMMSIFGTEAVIDLMTSLGTRQIEDRVMEYGAEVTEALEDMKWSVVSSHRNAERSGIISVQREGVDMDQLNHRLQERYVACAVREGRMRISMHFYNDRSDLERLLDCLPD